MKQHARCTSFKLQSLAVDAVLIFFVLINFLDGYTTETIKYHWCLKATDEKCKNAVTVQDDGGLPKFEFGNLCVNETITVLASGR